MPELDAGEVDRRVGGILLADSVDVLSAFEPGSSELATVLSKSSILRSKAVSCVSIAEAVFSPLTWLDSRVSFSCQRSDDEDDDDDDDDAGRSGTQTTSGQSLIAANDIMREG